jgi:hypothetical protein
MKRFAAMVVCATACVTSAAPVAGAFPTQPRGAAPIACVVTATKGATGAENADPTALANVAAVVAELC